MRHAKHLIQEMPVYMLSDSGVPYEQPDFHAWAKWFETFQPVKVELIDGQRVSTVFLGISLCNPPLLWETMVFGGKLDHFQFRCAGSREQAEAQHEKVCGMVKFQDLFVGPGS
jgi:hypothetical protein